MPLLAEPALNHFLDNSEIPEMKAVKKNRLDLTQRSYLRAGPRGLIFGADDGGLLRVEAGDAEQRVHSPLNDLDSEVHLVGKKAPANAQGLA